MSLNNIIHQNPKIKLKTFTWLLDSFVVVTLNWNTSMKYFHGTIKLLVPKFCLLKLPEAVNMSMLWTMFARLTRVLQNRLEDEVISCNGDLTDMHQMLPLFVLGWEERHSALKILLNICSLQQTPIFNSWHFSEIFGTENKKDAFLVKNQNPPTQGKSCLGPWASK